MDITLNDEETREAIKLYLAMNGLTRQIKDITFVTTRRTPPTTSTQIELDDQLMGAEALHKLGTSRREGFLAESGLPSFDSVSTTATTLPSDAQLKDDAWASSSENPANYVKTPDNPHGYEPKVATEAGGQKAINNAFAEEAIAENQSRAKMPGEKDLPDVPVAAEENVNSVFGNAAIVEDEDIPLSEQAQADDAKADAEVTDSAVDNAVAAMDAAEDAAEDPAPAESKKKVSNMFPTDDADEQADAQAAAEKNEAAEPVAPAQNVKNLFG